MVTTSWHLDSHFDINCKDKGTVDNALLNQDDPHSLVGGPYGARSAKFLNIDGLGCEYFIDLLLASLPIASPLYDSLKMPKDFEE